MKYVGLSTLRLALVFVLLCSLGLGPARAQATPPTTGAPATSASPNAAPAQPTPPALKSEPFANPKYDAVFAKARALEDTALVAKVQDAYQDIKKEYSQSGKDQEVAAESLIRDALYASSPRYGAVEIKNKRKELQNPTGTPDAIKEMQTQMENEGDQRAHSDIKQLFKEYPNSDAARRAHQPDWQGKEMQQWLEDRIDNRNSSSLNYKLMDYLVKITGRIPAFSYWFALVLLAVIVKAVTFPITLRMYKSQREMQRIQPILKEINEKYKGKPEYNEKIMECYKEHNVSPFASCVPLLIQLPFMWWVFNMVRQYEFHFSHGTFLWIGSALSHQFPYYIATNLAQFDTLLLVIYTASNYATMKLTPPTDPAAAQQQQSMSVMMSAVMFFIFWSSRWSAAFIFYWLMTNLISAYQQYKYIYLPNKGKLALAGAGGGTITLAASGKNGDGKDYSASDDRPARPAAQTPITPIPGGNAPRNRPRKRRR